MGAPTVGDVAARLEEVRARIAGAGGDAGRVRVVAVTKGFGPDAVRAALGAGLVDLGESYAQELEAKAPSGPGARWHLVGAVQRRKVRRLAPLVALWHSVDRPALAHEIARHAAGAGVLVQVEVSGRPGRAGCSWDEAPAVVGAARAAGLDVRGLMCVGSPDDPRPGFRRLAALGRDLGLAELSMGMSGDLEVAVEEGTTMVRVGTALFGPRPDRRGLRGYSHAQGGW